MRLLKFETTGALVFHTFESNDTPAYAILSHTWYTDDSLEVSFQDVQAGRGTEKPGFEKIRFCARQAAKDGLRYFWIDTCCINKSSDAELTESINSMFRWYQQATRCYVYLSDVLTKNTPSYTVASEDSIRQSRWFTRGWTLQELIAPKDVVFYASNGDWLGDKSSLLTLICGVTGIAKDALYGRRLDEFSFEEKMSWMARRDTKKEEDRVYSMLGMCGVSMPVVYGEGRYKALRRLRREVDDTPRTTVSYKYAVNLSLSRVPRAAKFIARERELSTMHELLYGHDNRSIAVLHGLGGIGKTQLAVAYLHRHKRRYSAVFWIDASSNDTIMLSFNKVARQILLQHPSTVVLASIDLEGSADCVVEAVLSWLSQPGNNKWLLIYDNYDKPKVVGYTSQDVVDISQYIPDCDHGSILITTRSSRVDLGPRIHVKRLTQINESLAILLNASGRVGLEEDPDAITLVKELDGLPLALSTAGAYLEHVTTSFAYYHQMYKASWLEVQRSSPQVTSYEDRALYTTWQLSLDQISQEDKRAVKLLKLWAYFDRQDVWYELLRGGQSCEWLEGVTQDRTIFDRTMRLLCSYGLVEPGSSEYKETGSIGYSVHSCVHAWMIHMVNKEWDEKLAKLALQCVASMVPSTDVDGWWVMQKRLLLHVTRCKEFVVNVKLDIRDVEWALHNVGDLYADQGKLVEAEAMYLRALQGYEEVLGPRHTSTLQTVNNLGVLYKNQGKLGEAEAMFMRALQEKEEALGAKHTSTLDTVNNLGNLYADQGKLGEAEAMYMRALQGSEEALGPRHTSTLQTVHNLGNLYFNQGKLDEAEAMYMRALQGEEEALGAKHPSTLQTVNNLGLLYWGQGKLGEAEAMFMRALQGKEEALGVKHPSTLQTVNNLGSLYADQDKLGEAEAMYMRALQGYEDALGAEHISTYIPALHTMWGLGELYARLNRTQNAQMMYERALAGFAVVRGSSSSTCKHIQTRLEALEELHKNVSPRD